MEEQPFMETELPDLSGMTLDDVACGRDHYAEALDIIGMQISHPRANLGGGGPPGRAD